jgi:YVTN family beta-propeller protein
MSKARILFSAMAAGLAMVLGGAASWAQNAYIANFSSSNVSVIDTTSNTVIGNPIALGAGVAPFGEAVTPDGSKVYVGNYGSDTVSVIATSSSTVVATITVGTTPYGLAVTPDGSKVYVANNGSNTVSVISTATDTVIATITVGTTPLGVSITPDGNNVYIANNGSNNVSVIATASNTVIGSPITVGTQPVGLAVSPDGSKVYVANETSNTVSVIGTATDTVIATIAVGTQSTGVAVTPDGSKVYVSNYNNGAASSVSVIQTATDTVTATVGVGNGPTGVAVTPDGSKVYVGNGFSNDVSVIATASDTVTATITVGTGPFAFGDFIGPPTLTVAETGSGSGQVTSNPAGINCSSGSGQCAAMFVNGTAVTLTASAATGSTFSGWSGGGCSGTGACVVDPTANSTVTATFTVVPSFILSVTVGGTGSGMVTSTPSGINCGATCSASFQSGTQVTLTAAATSGSAFAGWSGGGCSGTGTCAVTISAAESVSATFTAIPPVTLSVTAAGTGAGQVTSSPAGIKCSTSRNQCAAQFAVGTKVTLTASAAAGSSFAGWLGGGCGGTGTCTVTVNSDTSVTATFTAIPSYMLSVVPAGNGSGTVISSPSGIICGATCNASFASGTQITLTAAASGNSTFAGWSGGGCGGTGTCQVTLDAATVVTATFIQNSVTNIVLAAAVLPASRSVEVGATATVFATIVNAGPGDAAACGIAPQTSVPATFLYQTTDPTTNALNGNVNTPVDIAQGASQSFLIALTPTAAFAPTDVAFNFACANASPAPVISGVNTLEISGSTTPVPDIVALASSSDPGYVDLPPGLSGIGVFAVAAVNIGSTAQITVVANTGMSLLPMTPQVCQTDPTSGTCLQPPSSAVTITIAANATPTFNVFVASIVALAASPGTNRVFVTFSDGGGVLRGETSVAVRTQ